MVDDYEACNNNPGLGLGLSVGLGGYYSGGRGRNAPTASLVGLELDLSFSLRPKDEDSRSEHEHEHDRRQPDHQLITNKRTNHHLNNFNIDSSRKKLRLTKQQSTLLEESFKLHTTLNPVQKKTLAEQLNLKPRQVEVWFQNRRARTKLKQTEVDCEFMKKCCEKLKDENARLKKEVEELKEEAATPLYIQLPKAAATLSMCQSCHKRRRSSEGSEEQ